MCCTSKKKPTAPVQSSNVPVIQGNNQLYTSSMSNTKFPKSAIAFTANDYDSRPLTNQQNFVITKKVTFTS